MQKGPKNVSVASVQKPQVTYPHIALNESLGDPFHEYVVVFAVSIF